jgi:hyperosmotically inducible protein
MKLDRTARTLLSITALAWAVPFAQAGTGTSEPQVGVIQPQAESAGFRKLDADRDGFLSRGEVRHLDGYDEAFAEADRDRDGKLNPTEAITAHQLYERGIAARYAEDAWLTTKVKAALLREKGLDSMDVSVETFQNEVLLSGFVANTEQKKKALLVASKVEGVKEVKDGLAVR